MIKTGLPYDQLLFEDISNNGAIIDISKNELDLRTTFIYLRNTNFDNIKFDLSTYTSQQKANFIYHYLISDIQFYNQEILLTILSICLKYIKFQHNKLFLLNQFQIDLFIEQHTDIIQNIIQFVQNSYLSIILNQYENQKVDYTQTKKLLTNKNIYHLLKNNDVLYLFLYQDFKNIYFEEYKSQNLHLIISQSIIGCYMNYLLTTDKQQIDEKFAQLNMFFN